MNASQKIRIILAALVLICFSYAVTSAQSGSAQAAPAEAKTVTLSVTVRDKHDQVVRNLTRDDFMLEEDGRPQAIKYFLQPADMPLTVGLLVDTSPGLANVLGDQQRASRSFLDDMLVGTRDQAFLLPPDLREWLPADHLAWFVLDVVEQLDLGPFLAAYRADGHGRAAYDPRMLLGVLLYAYCTGIRSSRQIERHCQRGHRLPDPDRQHPAGPCHHRADARLHGYQRSRD